MTVRINGSLRMYEWRDRQFVIAWSIEWTSCGAQILRFIDGIAGTHAYSYSAWFGRRRWRLTNIPLVSA